MGRDSATINREMEAARAAASSLRYAIEQDEPFTVVERNFPPLLALLDQFKRLDEAEQRQNAARQKNAHLGGRPRIKSKNPATLRSRAWRAQQKKKAME